MYILNNFLKYKLYGNDVEAFKMTKIKSNSYKYSEGLKFYIKTQSGIEVKLIM